MSKLKKKAEIAFRESKPYLSDFNDFKEYMYKVLKTSDEEGEFIDKIEKYGETEIENKDLETDIKIFLQKFRNV